MRRAVIPSTILIVEDEHSVRDLLVRAVQRWFPSAGIFAAGSVEDAWEPLELHQPTVLITDYLLPGANGLELVAKARDAYPSLNIIVISALNLGSRPLEVGADTFLAKPLSLAALKQAIISLEA
jgi:CheY-like chemotaxis protein